MPALKRLVIEGQFDENHLSLLNPTLENLKAHFSGRCVATESINQSSGTARVFVAIEGGMEFSDLEAVRLEIMKVINLGCRVSLFDRMEKKKFISYVNNALAYGDTDTSFADSQPPPRKADRHEGAKPGWRWAVLMWLIVFLAVYAFRASFVRDTTVPDSPAGTAQATRGESGPVKPVPSTPSPDDPKLIRIPQFQMPMPGIRLEQSNPVNKAALEQLQKIVGEYRATHTYSMDDLFVCADMAIEVWNILKTKRIKARILAGRVDQDITHLNGLQYLGHINHAWIVAEPDPGVAVPLETTGGYVVTPDKPNYLLYFEGADFGSPKAFKEFLTLRNQAFDTCNQVQTMESQFNATYAGKPVSPDSIAYKGRVEQKIQDCVDVLSRLERVILARD